MRSRSADDRFHHGRSVGFVEARDDVLVIHTGHVRLSGLLQQIGGGFPRTKHFPIFRRILRGHADVACDGVIRAALGRPHIAQAAHRLRAEVCFLGKFPEQIVVMVRGQRKKADAFGALRLGRWQMKLFDRLVK
jgi:hypothetical protein